MPAKKPIILMVDDSKDFRDIFSLKLSNAGFEVVTVSSAVEAFDKLKKIKPDLILLDMEMPGTSGIEALEAIKQNPATKDIRVVFLTNFGEIEEELVRLDQKFAREIGAVDYIKKTDDLDKTVSQIVANMPQKSRA